MRRPHVLTNSSVGYYLNCQEYYRLKIIVGISTIRDRDAFAFGAAAHNWIEAWSLCADLPKITLDDPFQNARLEAMLTGYGIRWEQWQRDHVSSTSPEREFHVPLVNPDTGAKSTYWEVRGKLDDYMYVDGRWLVKEIKTTSDTSNGYFEKLRIDSQISTYLMAAPSLGFPAPEGVLYDVLKKPQIRPLQRSESYALNKDGSKPKNKREFDETPEEFGRRCLEVISENPEEYYQHYEVVRLESEVTKAAKNLWFIGAAIRESIWRDRWAQNTRACYSPVTRKFCEYWPICSGRSNVGDTSLFERRAPFQELPEYRAEIQSDIKDDIFT